MVPGEPPGLDQPLAHVALELDPRRDAQAVEQIGIGVERMGREVEADRRELALEPLGERPRWTSRGSAIGSGTSDANMSMMPSDLSVVSRWAVPMIASITAKACSRLRRQPVERAGIDQRFERPAVDDPRIDARGEVGKVGERPVAARRDDVLGDRRADALDGADGVEDLAVARREHGLGAVDVGRQDLDAVLLRVRAEFGELVGVAHVERHRRGEEFLRRGAP